MILAEVPGIACGIFSKSNFKEKSFEKRFRFLKKKSIFEKKKNSNFFWLRTPEVLKCTIKECQPIRSSRLANYSWHKYERKSLSIYKFGLSGCLFVSDKRQNGWTDQAQIFCVTSRDHREGLWMIKIFKYLSPSKFDRH